MRIFQEEIFGPVVVGDAASRTRRRRSPSPTTRSTASGAGVWTRDGNTAYRMGRGIQAGRVWTNCYHAYPAHAAFGGYKRSGIGRENHKMMLDHYQQTKNLLVSYSPEGARLLLGATAMPPRLACRRHRGAPSPSSRSSGPRHGALMFHQSGGCCDGSAPMCYPRATSSSATPTACLGEIGGCPFYMGAAQFEYWRHTQLIIDVVPGRGGMFSLENGEGVRFLTRSRVFTDEEYGALAAVEGGRTRARAAAAPAVSEAAAEAARLRPGEAEPLQAPVERHPGDAERLGRRGEVPAVASRCASEREPLLGLGRGERAPAGEARGRGGAARDARPPGWSSAGQAARTSAGRSTARSSRPGAVAAARSTTLRSCRTLPGQEQACSAAIASSERVRPVRPTSASACSRKAWARSGTSSGRWRSGGIGMERTSSR